MTLHRLQPWVRQHLPQLVGAIRQAREDVGDDASPDQLIETAAGIAAGLIDVPVLPEHVERLLFRAAITVLVELAQARWKDRWCDELGLCVEGTG